MEQNFYSDSELKQLDEGELKSIFLKIRSEILQHMRENKKTRVLEIYYCYITRELQNR
jgi:hypothetical protein